MDLDHCCSTGAETKNSMKKLEKVSVNQYAAKSISISADFHKIWYNNGFLSLLKDESFVQKEL